MERRDVGVSHVYLVGQSGTKTSLFHYYYMLCMTVVSSKYGYGTHMGSSNIQ